MKNFRGPDPKPEKRVKDPQVMRQQHQKGVRCVLCGNEGSLHHIYPKGQGGDDVLANLIALCGDGVTGHHGLIEALDVATRLEVGQYLQQNRPDTVFYMERKLGEEQGREWLRQRYYMTV